mgnify:CR=1 FL=1
MKVNVLRLIVGLLGMHSIAAQEYEIPVSVISGGAGVSSGGIYSLRGTVGQPDAGRMSGGAFALEGGFWAVVAGARVPEAPLLSITRQAETIVMSWPVSAEGFVLEETAALLVPAPAWIPVTLPVRTNATEVSVTVALPVGTRFYRLVRP